MRPRRSKLQVTFALLQEPLHCQAAVPSAWSAQRIRAEFPELAEDARSAVLHR